MKTLNHIAIIMDGNRRWARSHGLPISEGHRKAVFEITEPLIDHAAERGIGYLTFWAFSTENWKRSKQEVMMLMSIFRKMIKMKWLRLHEKGVRIKVIGDTSKFPKDIASSIEDVVEQTKNNKKITVVFALNYGGRDEITRAIQKLLENNKLQITNNKKITEEDISEALDTSGIPDPDLIVRTGGEERLSGFLLWQSNYSEFMFPTWYFPEFTPEKLDEIISEYQKRERRYGA